MVKVPPWQCPSSASVPPQGAPGSSGWLGAPTGETGPLGAQPLPRVLELATSEAADFPTFDHPGKASPGTLARLLTCSDAVISRLEIVPGDDRRVTALLTQTRAKFEAEWPGRTQPVAPPKATRGRARGAARPPGRGRARGRGRGRATGRSAPAASDG